jgi:hypothetical protein
MERLGGDLVFVELTCPEAEIERRLDNPERRALDKISSVEAYRKLRNQGAFEAPVMPTPAVKIDTSQCTPSEAAARIVTFLDV